MDDVSALMEVIDRLAAAERAGDADAMRELLDDELRFRRANGSVVNRDGFLESLRTSG